MNIDLNNLCRTCMSESHAMLPIFESDDNKYQITSTVLDMLQAFTIIQVKLLFFCNLLSKTIFILFFRYTTMTVYHNRYVYHASAILIVHFHLNKKAKDLI